MADLRSLFGKDARPGILQGQHVLVVEDEYILALDFCSQLADEGAVIVGPCARVDAALDLVGRSPQLSLATLDVRLQDQMVWPVADALLVRRIPFIFVTGFDASLIPSDYAQIPRAEKPVGSRQLSQMLLSALR